MAGAASRISRCVLTGPLAPFAEEYRRESRERGYTERSAVNELGQVAGFSGWLPASRLSVSDMGAGRVEECPAGGVPSGGTGPSGRGRGWCACSTCSRELGVSAARAARLRQADSPAEVLLAGFGRYLAAAARSSAAGTVRGYVSHARRS